VVEVAGEDRLGFLQGLVSNDVSEAGPGHSVWAALLTPQGKWLADFFILAEADRLLLDCERAQAPMLTQRLSRFRLRAKVTVRDISADFAILAGWGDAPMPEGAVPDPRLPEAGWRALVAPGTPGDTPPEAYDRHRLELGLPAGSRDLEAEQSILLEAGFDELHGVSWTKGCYMGQELTARTHYRGLIKRRLVPVVVEGPLPPRGTPITLAGETVGEMRSGLEGLGMAQLRLPALRAGALTCGEARLTPRPPAWMTLPDTAEAG
jgi:folate-binding protein YgfZ